jgi:hypothetical protein
VQKDGGEEAPVLLPLDHKIRHALAGRVYFVAGYHTDGEYGCLNDGENDINFIRQCVKPLSIEVDENIETIDVVLEPSNDDMECSVSFAGVNKYDLTWTLLKKDEFVDLVIVTKGKELAAENVKMTVRAEGIEKIKSPEYRVWPQLWPMLLAISIFSVLMWFTMPAEVTFIPVIPQNMFWTGLFLLMIPAYTILVLVKKIKWEKE